MTLPLVLPIALTDIEAEFSAPPGTPLSAFVREGDFVPSNSDNLAIPDVLPLRITDFFGASATIPIVLVLPDTGSRDQHEIDGGIHVTGEHLHASGTIENDEKWVVDVTLRCNTDHVDSDDLTPQLPGYSWARQRMSFIVGQSNDGVVVDFFFTSATSGYIRLRTIHGAQYSNTSAGYFHDVPGEVYGNFVIPSGDDAVRVRITRGEGITQRESVSGTLFELDYNIYIYTRNAEEAIWLSGPMRYNGGGNEFAGLEHNSGGPLEITNDLYNDGATCDLTIERLEAAIGVFEIP